MQTTVSFRKQCYIQEYTSMLVHADVGACMCFVVVAGLFVPPLKNITTRTKANWIGHNLRRNCLLNHVVEGKEEGMTEVT